MCGIAGWMVKPGCEWRPSMEFIWTLFDAIEMRGRDATGYGTLLDDDRHFMMKGPLEAKPFMKKLRERPAPVGRIGLLHTRAATVGSPEQNNNNHPIGYEADNGHAVLAIHNGTIGNLEASYKALGIDPIAEVDSALIAPAMAMEGPEKGLKFLEQHSCGQATIAAVWEDGTLLLARDTRPLILGIVQDNGEDVALIWSSDKYGLDKLCGYSSFGLEMVRLLEFKDFTYAMYPGGSLTPKIGGFRLKGMQEAPQRYVYNRGGQANANSFPGNKGGSHGVSDSGPTKNKGYNGIGSGNGAGRGAEAGSSKNPENVAVSSKRRVICRWEGCWEEALERGVRESQVCRRHQKAMTKHNQKFRLSGPIELTKKQAKEA